MRRTACGFHHESGFTFVEIMVTLLISVIVMAGMYQAFNTLHKWWSGAGIQSDQRNNARSGLETFTRDLEMAGYLTTNYGDINKTGLAITFASAHEIEMDQQRPSNETITAAAPAYEPRLVYYHLATDMRSGRQNLYRQIRTQPGLSTTDELVAENVGAFSLEYYDKDNIKVTGLPPDLASGSAAYTPGVVVPAGSPLRAIRRIQVSLSTIAARTLPFGLPSKAYTLTASVSPQNLTSANEATADVAPPLPPSGVAVIDKQSCSGKLRVKWNPNAELDLAGYVVFYGTTDKVVIPIRSLADKTLPEITLNPEGLLITKFADSGRVGSTADTPNTYSIQVVAYDSGGNYSGRSTAVSGAPSSDVTRFEDVATLGNDTTVNPLKPAASAGLTVAHGSHDGELAVSWQASAGATTGYRLYRSTAAFAGGHIDNSLQIKDEGTLTSEVATWTDTNLEGCKTYYYAVVAVNCDETLVAGYQFDSANPAAGDYAVGSGAPLDTSIPPTPVLAAPQPEVQRAFVTLVNPLESACADFDRTEIRWSRADGSTGAVSGGIFRDRGSQVIVFDSEAAGTPLVEGATYDLRAISYDRCGNASPPAALALVIPTAATVACAATPLVPPPYSFTAPSYSSCQPNTVEIGWQYPGWDTVPGFVGFRIERSGPGGAVPLTAGPTTLMSWTDAGSLEAGAAYTYSITATDCLYESDPLLYSLNASISFSIPPVPPAIQPGQLQRYQPLSGTTHELDAANFVTTASDVPASYTYHNNVKFFLQNTSQSPMTIKRMAVDWDNPNVVLDSVTIGGSPSSTTQRTVSAGGAASGAAFTVDIEIADVAGGIGNPSGAVPVLLRFATPSGAVNRLTDMRNETLNISLWVRNNSLQDVECPIAAKMAIDVPRGPVLGGFSQSAPGLYGIDAYEVTGASASARDTDIKVPYGITVNVFGTAFDNSRDLFRDGVNRGFSTLKLVGSSIEAAAPAAVPAMPASGTFFERPLQPIGGNRYTIYRTPPTPPDALMPEVSNQVNWYYALAVDATGNWDRVPNPDHGSYAYFQPPFDVCTATPRPPVLTLVSTSPIQALLTWTAPTQYENGLSIPAGDPLTYDVFVKSAGGDPWPSTPTGAGLSGLSFFHSADLTALTYYYMVRAKNSCASPRVSGYSNVEMECEGGSMVDCSLFGVPATARYGDPIALAMSGICTYRKNLVHDDSVVSFSVLSGGTTTNFPALETFDDGAFTKTIAAVWSGGGGDNVLATSGTLSVNLVVAGATTCTARTVTLTGGECFTTPNPPSLSAAHGASGSGAAVLTLVKPNFNTDGTPLTDLAGYEIGISRCAAASSGNCNSGPWTPETYFVLDDPLAQTYTWTGLVIDERYRFRLRAKDSCATPNFSSWTGYSTVVKVQ